MTDTSWTPGPWRDFMGDICAQDDEIVIAAMNRSCGARSSEYQTYKAKHPVALANARLIAAAPDMAEALVLAEAAMEYMGNILNNMDAVLPEDEGATEAAFEAVRVALAKAKGATT